MVLLTDHERHHKLLLQRLYLFIDTKLGIMFNIIISENAYSDLKDIAAENPDKAAKIAALIHTINSDQDLLSRLTNDNFENYDEPQFNVDTWVSAQRERGISLWRLKFLEQFDIAAYRIIYTYDGTKNNENYYILAVVHREFNYETRSDLAIRIFNDYRDLDLYITGH